MIIANYAIMLREKAYIERSAAALDEARVYEQKQDGTFGAKEGKHDDILMTRMIGCYVCYSMKPPYIPNREEGYSNHRKVGESSI